MIFWTLSAACWLWLWRWLRLPLRWSGGIPDCLAEGSCIWGWRAWQRGFIALLAWMRGVSFTVRKRYMPCRSIWHCCFRCCWPCIMSGACAAFIRGVFWLFWAWTVSMRSDRLWCICWVCGIWKKWRACLSQPLAWSEWLRLSAWYSIAAGTSPVRSGFLYWRWRSCLRAALRIFACMPFFTICMSVRQDSTASRYSVWWWLSSMCSSWQKNTGRMR